MSEFSPALRLWEKPSKRNSFEELGGFETTTPDGSCWTFVEETILPKFTLKESLVRERLVTELTLVKGIGPERERILLRKGVRSLKDLKNTKWSCDAEEISEVLMNGTIPEIIELFRERKRGSDPLLTGLGGFCPKEELLFYDIETLGMTHSPIILFGVGVCSDEKLITTQYLLRNISEEITALGLISEAFKTHPIPVTYNGRCFDLPYTNNRLAFYGEKNVSEKFHIDLLPSTRRLFKHKLPDCCLGTVENHVLDIPRENDLPGYLVPLYYQRYLSEKDPHLLKGIVEHNRSDVTSLALLLAKQVELVYGC